MDDNQLISKIKSLKQIKPEDNWVALVRSQILGTEARNTTENNRLDSGRLFNNIFGLLFQKKLAYAYAAIMFALIGVSGLGYLLTQDIKVIEESPAALIEIKSNLETFREKSKSFSEIAKNESPQNVSLAMKEVKDAAKNLTDAVQKNPKLARTIALEVNNNKTYLNVQGGSDLKETSDNLCKAVIGPMIEDTEKLVGDIGKESLVEGYRRSLDEIKAMQNQDGCYSALENILLLYIAVSGK
jgi:hypothetical protein